MPQGQAQQTGSAQQRAELEAILETAQVGIAFNRSHPPPRHFVHCNPAFEAMFGWAKGELIGKPTSCVWPSAEAYAQALRIAEAALRRGEAVELVSTLVRRDGSTFEGQVRAKMVAQGPGRPEGTVMIFEDMTRRNAQDAALAAALREAEAANQAKSTFVANLSHEIRNPLNALLGLAHLAHASTGDAERTPYLRQILASALMLKDLLDNSLDFSKIEAGQLTMAQRPFDVHSLLTELAATWHPVALGKGLRLTCQIGPATPVALVGDALRIRQILSNFLSNALKFSGRGEVQLRCIPEAGGGLRVEVCDQGPGLSAEQQARLFQRFVQLDGPATGPQTQGTGLGLAICRDLAERMGGQVGVHSVPGQGACFWLRLALPEPEVPAPAAAPAAPAPEGDASSRQALAGLRVLVVEDDEVNQLIAQTFIERWGGHAQVAGDGQQALQTLLAGQAAGQPFHVALMDLHMPVMGGIAATRQIRQHPSLAGLVVIGLSAAALPDEVNEALQAGMAEVVTKPFDPPSLRNRLGRLAHRD